MKYRLGIRVCRQPSAKTKTNRTLILLRFNWLFVQFGVCCQAVTLSAVQPRTGRLAGGRVSWFFDCDVTATGLQTKTKNNNSCIIIVFGCELDAENNVYCRPTEYENK